MSKKLVELKPCPFCGQEPKRVQSGLYYVMCANPKCLVSTFTVGYVRMSDATKAWNRRVEQ